ncbi:NAD(P)H-dependent oxidoreductase [Elizabethkingia argentiflava]|uniref:NAD(P)H-dependent oxidoreductase n=1 Tax=Elizabethkingia argenteiflava TaxID=2681556 RepID=A0A845PR37_9FLAO|nr:nitroreductase family protein [Elizabethkingia argenteiflava]NAW50304.1 NAD(P)H-dependent oxidoreductase [Elizabethkingia argenteiflava]
MALIEDLKWRHAVKAYKPNEKVSQENIDKIVEAARLAPSSSGLQPFKVIVIKDQQIKEKLTAGALNPECMRDASHVIIFAAWDRYTAERIDKVYDFTTDERGLPRGRFGSYTDKLKNIYLDQPAELNFAHTARQTYIALGLALAQAAELKVDTTPVEGFDNAVVDEVLNLREQGLRSVSLMYVGIADPANDWIAPMKKVRSPKADFVIEF